MRRAILGDPTPWRPLSLPFDGMTPDPAVPWDRDARPGLDEVLTLRADRMQTVRQVIEGLTEESLASNTEPVDGPGYPDPAATPSRSAWARCSSKSGNTASTRSGTSTSFRDGPDREGLPALMRAPRRARVRCVARSAADRPEAQAPP